ncbi:MAG: hypothetical protein R3B84_17760 [Zavarzinella sp.]
MQFFINKAEVALHEDIRLNIKVSGPAPLVVKIASNPLLDNPHWLALSTTEPVTQVLTNQAVWEIRYRYSPLHPGDLPLQLAPLTIESGGNPQFTIEMPDPIFIKVPQVETAADLSNLREKLEVEAPPDLPKGSTRSIWWRIVLVGGGILLLSLGWYEYRRRKRIPPTPIAMYDTTWATEQVQNWTGSGDELRQILTNHLSWRCQQNVEHLTPAELSQLLILIGFTTELADEMESILAALDAHRYGGEELPVNIQHHCLKWLDSFE